MNITGKNQNPYQKNTPAFKAYFATTTLPKQEVKKAAAELIKNGLYGIGTPFFACHNNETGRLAVRFQGDPQKENLLGAIFNRVCDLYHVKKPKGIIIPNEDTPLIREMIALQDRWLTSRSSGSSFVATA